MNLSKQTLKQLYLKDSKSVAQIAQQLNISEGKVNYWLMKYKIPKRTISEAVYRKWNPEGDPFRVVKIRTRGDAVLYGMGLGLYWGEGTKRDLHSVRLGNSDPELLKVFILFLERVYSINRKDLKFGLQIFSTMNAEESLSYWCRKLKVSKSQFYKIIITPSTRSGTYLVRNIEGVVTLYYHNVKLRIAVGDALKKFIEDISIARQLEIV